MLKIKYLYKDWLDFNLELEVAVTFILLRAEDLGAPVSPVLGSLLVLLLNIPVQQAWLPEKRNYYLAML